jgi:hypothetical protein
LKNEEEKDFFTVELNLLVGIGELWFNFSIKAFTESLITLDDLKVSNYLSNLEK